MYAYRKECKLKYGIKLATCIIYRVTLIPLVLSYSGEKRALFELHNIKLNLKIKKNTAKKVTVKPVSKSHPKVQLRSRAPNTKYHLFIFPSE